LTQKNQPISQPDTDKNAPKRNGSFKAFHRSFQRNLEMAQTQRLPGLIFMNEYLNIYYVFLANFQYYSGNTSALAKLLRTEKCRSIAALPFIPLPSISIQ
jgi:hypothetical protein